MLSSHKRITAYCIVYCSELESKAVFRTYKIFSTGNIPVADVLVEFSSTVKHVLLTQREKQ
jgi:hypothetical protein